MVDETKKGAERILQATIDVLLTNGLQAATTRQVTEQAGVGRGLLNHYYNWQELRVLAWEVIFEEVIHDQFAQFTAADQAIEYYLACKIRSAPFLVSSTIITPYIEHSLNSLY